MNIFYTDYAEDVSVDEPIDLTLEEALTSFYNLTSTADNFWGIKTNSGLTVQFIYLNDEQWEADVPVARMKGSYKKRCTFDECRQIVIDIFSNKDWAVPNSFVFENW